MRDDDDDDDEDICEINVYHPDTNKWGNAIDTPHALFAMTVLMDKLIIVGGARNFSNITNKLLTLQGGQWEEYSKMPTARWGASAVSHQSVMIVMGGQDENHILGNVELLDNTTGQWFKCNDVPKPLYFLQSVIVDNVLYIPRGRPADGTNRAVFATSLDVLSTYQLQWQQQLIDTPFIGSTGISLNNKYLIMVGGAASRDTVCVLKSEERLTSWESIGSVPKAHMGASAVSIGNQIILIGGDIVNAKTVTVGKFQ